MHGSSGAGRSRLRGRVAGMPGAHLSNILIWMVVSECDPRP